MKSSNLSVGKLHQRAKKAMRSAVRKVLARHEAAGVPAAVWKNGRVVSLSFTRSKSKSK